MNFHPYRKLNVRDQKACLCLPAFHELDFLNPDLFYFSDDSYCLTFGVWWDFFCLFVCL